jgi:predicted membrane protein
MIFGVFFLLLGVSMLLKVFFKVQFPLVRVCFAVFLLYLGIRMVFGTFSIFETFRGKDTRSVVFAEGDLTYKETGEDVAHYSVIFGRATIDLTHVPLDERDVRVEINDVFGSVRVLIDSKAPAVIRANAVFADAKMPDDNLVAFGTLKYAPQKKSGKLHTLTVESNAVFGSLKFQAQDVEDED